MTIGCFVESAAILAVVGMIGFLLYCIWKGRIKPWLDDRFEARVAVIASDIATRKLNEYYDSHSIIHRIRDIEVTIGRLGNRIAACEDNIGEDKKEADVARLYKRQGTKR